MKRYATHSAEGTIWTGEIQECAIAHTPEGQNFGTFTINPAYKLELVAAKPNQLRSNIENIRVEYDKVNKRNVAVATNGHSMAIVPVVIPEDETGQGKVEPCLISPTALKAVRKIKRGPQGYFNVNSKIELSDGTAFPVPETDLPYPNWRKEIPSAADKITFSITLNPQFLLDLAKAIGSPESVRIDFIDALSPMQVRGGRYGTEPDASGILMPMRNAD